jgi:hypothetical protein
VFLNVPYDDSYEQILVGLTAALVALGRVPQLTFQVPDGGEGRLQRIFSLLKSCRVSIHDLSAVGTPVRFNMPFELGLACAIKAETGEHDFLILESRRHRLDRHLSDLKGIDPKIHNRTVGGAICAILEVLDKPSGNPPLADVRRLYLRMIRLLGPLKKRHGAKNVFNTRVYGELTAFGFEEARQMGL